MPHRLAGITICFAGLVLLSVPAAAGPIAMCNASVWGIPENILLQLPFIAIAGDAIVTESGGVAGQPERPDALIDRGTCAISLKVDAAAKAGAIGTLIGLVAPGDAVSFSYGGGTNFVPSLVVTQATSNTIKSALLSSPVNATISPKNALPVPFSTLCGPG